MVRVRDPAFWMLPAPPPSEADLSALITQTSRLKLTNQPFRFFSLPFELRAKILSHLLLLPKPIDLDPSNPLLLHPLLQIFRVSKAMHAEASAVFYGRNTFRLYPVHGRFHVRLPLLGRLSKRNRAKITTMELRLGPGWHKPPAWWCVHPRVGLQDAKNLRVLKIFVECDPSDPIFRGWVPEGFYTRFCTELLQGILRRVGSLKEVRFDGYESVRRMGPLMSALEEEVRKAQGGRLRVVWNPARRWDEEHSVDELADALGLVNI